jgi:hypothetical protein
LAQAATVARWKNPRSAAAISAHRLARHHHVDHGSAARTDACVVDEPTNNDTETSHVYQ